METMEEIKQYIEQISQSAFDRYAKPIIIKEMKRFKIKSIEPVMGVTFFKMNDGRTLTEDEFSTTDSRRDFISRCLDPWSENPFYRLIDPTIKI